MHLRPHAKTHKSLEIARRQIEAGAVGICCATLGEAEVMVQGGIPGVHITSPQVTASKIERLIALNRTAPLGLSVVVDHPDNLAALDAAAERAGHAARPSWSISAPATAAPAAPTPKRWSRWRAPRRARAGLILRGIQAYSGNLQHIPQRAERMRRAQEQRSILRRVIQQVRDAGIAVEIVTGAGTGTYDLDSEDGPFTELQVGSYIFMDVDYQRAMLDGANTPPFETALFVSTAVVSANAAGYVTTDAGLKCFRHRRSGAGSGERARRPAAATSSSATNTASSFCPTARRNRRSARASNASPRTATPR